MKAGIFTKKGKVSVEDVEEPKLAGDDQAILRITYSCICGSDLWFYRGLAPREKGSRIGHELIGVVERVGSRVKKIKKGDIVIVPFFVSCGKCPECKNGVAGTCRNGQGWGRDGFPGAQGEKVNVSHADASLFKIPSKTPEALMPSLLTLSDVMCTGHHAAVSASVKKGSNVVVVGDGAVGLCGVIAAKRLGAKMVILLSRNEKRQRLGKKFGATNIIAERGEVATKKIMKLTGGIGADSVLECVGTNESWKTALASVRGGGQIGWVGLPHGAAEGFPLSALFPKNIGIRGGRASVASYIGELLPDVLSGKINPGLVFDKTIKLEDLDKGYQAMDRREAIKVLIKL